MSKLCSCLLLAICKVDKFLSVNSPGDVSNWVRINKRNIPVPSYEIVEERCNFCNAYFLSRAHPATSSEQHEVWMRFHALLLFSVSNTGQNFHTKYGSSSITGVSMIIISRSFTYQPSPWIEGNRVRIQERIVVYLSCVNINSPTFWNDIPWKKLVISR
jgi:hypothetical protein